MSRRVWVALLLAGIPSAACGANTYGYARTYEPLSGEDEFLAQAVPLTYEEVRRAPTEHRSTVLGWFGVVTAVDPEATSGRTRITMTYRSHQERHLCADETSASCRVTITERPGGTFSASLALTAEERSGPDRLWLGSLLRVYGTPTGELDDTGGPILEARYYRHWPRREYVTTGAASSMRR